MFSARARPSLPSSSSALLAVARSRWSGGKKVTAAAVGLERRPGERRDSVDDATLHDRAMHALRMERAPYDKQLLRHIERLSLGRFKRWQDQKRVSQRMEAAKRVLAHPPTVLGRRGVLLHVSEDGTSELSAINREGVPEVALLGHSNSGKSALLNALGAIPTRKGTLAEVHGRAGWTSKLSFVNVVRAGEVRAGERRRNMILVDTPGYGFSVGVMAQLKHFRVLLDQYMRASRQLSLAVVLIDSTRGVCEADRRVLRHLRASGVRVLPVMTKADLLEQDQLASSHAVIRAQLEEELGAADGDHHRGGGGSSRVPRTLQMVSSHFYTGVKELWLELWQQAPRPLQSELPRAARTAEAEAEAGVGAGAAAASVVHPRLGRFDGRVAARGADVEGDGEDRFDDDDDDDDEAARGRESFGGRRRRKVRRLRRRADAYGEEAPGRQGGE